MKLLYIASFLLTLIIFSSPIYTYSQNFLYKISADSTGFDGRVFTLSNGNTFLVNQAIVLTRPFYTG